MNRQEYLLNKVAQEANEIAHRASKALEFGLNETQPGQQFTNAERMMQEIIDLYGVVAMCEMEDVFHLPLPAEINQGMMQKQAKVQYFMQYSRRLGCLQD